MGKTDERRVTLPKEGGGPMKRLPYKAKDYIIRDCKSSWLTDLLNLVRPLQSRELAARHPSSHLHLCLRACAVPRDSGPE